MSDEEEVFLSDETKALLEKRSGGCFLCLLILADHDKNNKLTGYPWGRVGNGEIFPVSAKIKHIELEKASAPGPTAPGQ